MKSCMAKRLFHGPIDSNAVGVGSNRVKRFATSTVPEEFGVDFGTVGQSMGKFLKNQKGPSFT